MAAAGKGPGVRFPPPFLFAGGFLISWLLDRRLPFLIAGSGPSRVQTGFGLVMLGIGLAFMFSGLGTFVRQRTAVIPHKPARLLVQTGPYRRSRNPMYVGLTWAYVGVSLMLNWAWPLVLLPFVLIALTTFVIHREERYLREAFGTAYEDYCRRVPRWL